ncbi:DUF2716 domain-containing protein [Streptomyces sp. R41]|uniref:DUF2716 domain-containing protein n=1 Tax=Streptomyces sp. R41 TaxID=3238632 RepID=A0AB39RUW4_9ACTN
MKSESVTELPEAEYRSVCDRFYAEFAFRQSVDPAKWPAIKELADSITWSLASLDEDPGYVRLERFVTLVEQGLTDRAARTTVPGAPAVLAGRGRPGPRVRS